MSEVKRWDWHVGAGCFFEDKDGLYVEFPDYEALAAENARLRAELEQSRDLIIEMSKHCNATALVADWLERNA